MIRPVEVKATEPYTIWLRYEDGTQGEVDLSELAGHGVFEAWEDRRTFEAVEIGEFGQVMWGAEIEVDPYALYMRLTSKKPHQLFPNLGETKAGLSGNS